MRATKLLSFIGWRGSWRKLCLHYIVWLRWSKEIVDLRKTPPYRKWKPCQQVKTVPGDGTSLQETERGWRPAQSHKCWVNIKLIKVPSPAEKGVICTEDKFHMPTLPSTYKWTELLEGLNERMEWVPRDYGISLKQAEEPLTPREYVIEFGIWTLKNEFEGIYN